MGAIVQKAETKAAPFTQEGTKAINLPPERSCNYLYKLENPYNQLRLFNQSQLSLNL